MIAHSGARAALVGLALIVGAACDKEECDREADPCCYDGEPEVEVAQSLEALGTLEPDDPIIYSEAPQGGGPRVLWAVRARGFAMHTPYFDVHITATLSPSGLTRDIVHTRTLVCANVGPNQGWLVAPLLDLQFVLLSPGDIDGQTAAFVIEVTTPNGDSARVQHTGVLRAPP